MCALYILDTLSLEGQISNRYSVVGTALSITKCRGRGRMPKAKALGTP